MNLEAESQGRMIAEPPLGSIPAGPPSPPSSPGSGNSLPGFTILITDDDTGSRQTLAGLLSDRGFETLQASSGEEAIEIVRVELIHLIFFDMHMPRMTGLEALQQVRIFNEMLPAILVTADVTTGLMREALQAQVYSVLPKPVNQTVMLYTLMRALNKMYGQPPTPPTATPSSPAPGPT